MAATKSYGPGWYLVKATNGTISIVKHAEKGAIDLGHGLDVQTAKLITSNTNASFQDVTTSKPTNTKTQTLLASLKPTKTQVATFVQSVDVGAALDHPGVTQVNLPSSGDPTASSGTNPASTATKSEATNAAPDPSIPGLSGLEAVATFLTSASNWVRIGEAIAGIILIAMGLRTLSGSTSTPVSVVTGGARMAARVAA